MLEGTMNSDERKQAFSKRVSTTEALIKQYYDKSLATMLSKNRDRGDCWRNSGLLGQFIEIHSMYFRLRNLIYEMEIPKPSDSVEFLNWAAQVENALEDMRNFTMLGEMCLQELNLKGEKFNVSKEL